jgi:LmbE family N-acetylglucosaminyl deacetylase
MDAIASRPDASVIQLRRGGGLAPLPEAVRPEPRRIVLAIGAHPDDIELGCAAALARYRAEGLITHGLVLTRGERGADCHDHELAGDIRVDEATRAASVLGLDSLEVLEYPDGRLTSCEIDVRGAIEATIVRLQPDIVITHNRFDLHSDHRVVASVSLEAARSVPTLLCYENASTPPDFKPNMFVDVTTYVDCKIDAIRCHETQRNKPYIGADLVRSMARVRGYQARVTYAEAFEAVRVRWA